MSNNLEFQLVYSGLFALGDARNFEAVAFAPGDAHEDERLERYVPLSALADAVYVPQSQVREVLRAFELEVASL